MTDRVAGAFHHLSALAAFVVLVSNVVSAAGAESSSKFEPGPCPFSQSDAAPYHVDCGSVAVPEYRARTDSPLVRLKVAIVRSAMAHPLHDPVVFLEGGPGGPSLDVLTLRVRGSPLVQRILQSRDLIYWDQRGTGESEPHLCRTLDVEWFRNAEVGFSLEEERRRNLAVFKSCAAELARAHTDVTQFGTETSAADLEDIRIALAVNSWNLYGGSYGTRLGLAAMRQTPGHIRAALLDGVYPPNAPQPIAQAWRLARVIDLLGKRCGEDLRCNARYPNIAARTYGVIERAARDPFTVPVIRGDAFPVDHLVVNDRLLALGLFQAFYDTRLVPYLPALIEQIERRNQATFEAMAQSLVSNVNDVRQGVFFAVECRESMAMTDAAGIATSNAATPRLNGAFADDASWTQYCDTWQPSRALPRELEAVESAIPTLLVAGDFDPVTPPAYAELAREALSSSTLLEVPNAGHSGKNSLPCVVGVESTFLADPLARLDTRCADRLPRAPFETQVLVLPGLTRLLVGLQTGSLRLTALAAAVAVVLQAACIVVILGGAIRRRFHARQTATTPDPTLRRIVLAAGGSAMAAFAWLSYQVATAAASNPNVLLLGLEGKQGVLVSLAAVATVLAVVTIGILLLNREGARRSLLGWLGGAGAATYLAGEFLMIHQ